MNNNSSTENIKCSNNKCSNNFIYVLDKYYFCCMRSKINEIIYYLITGNEIINNNNK